MGAYWLRDLPDVIADAGLRLELWDGWEARARSSGGYDAVWAVFVHHTASSTSPDNDRRYMWDNADDRPIGALYLARDGVVTVGAAGATNCQGKGGPYQTSHGKIPTDKANSYGVAVEAANAGTGEAWPTAQTDAYVTLAAALCAAYGLDPTRDVVAHREWAPDRKIDPAGPSPWATGADPWHMTEFRVDVAACAGVVTPPPIPPPPEDEVTDEDIDKIAQAAAWRVWSYMLGNIVTGEMDEAADIMRTGAYDAHCANPDHR